MAGEEHRREQYCIVGHESQCGVDIARRKMGARAEIRGRVRLDLGKRRRRNRTHIVSHCEGI